MVLVDVNSRADPLGIEFGVELRRIHVVAHTERLDRAVGRVREADDISWERTGCLLVPTVRIEDVGQIFEEGVIATGGCQRDPTDHADGLAVGAVDSGADNRTERADAVTTAEKRKVAINETTDQGE